MRKLFLVRVARLLSLVMLLAILVAPGARAASQTITAQMTSVTKTGFTLSLSWSAVTGASSYQIRYETNPSVDVTNSTLYTSTSATSHASTMNSTIGYRFFRIYAYNSSGTLLAYSNVVGIAKYPSGLVVRMKQDSALTSSYPAPSSSPNSAYYQKPTWFITVDSTVRASSVAANFQMSEFIHQTGITSALVDPKMVQHVQDARNRYGVMIVNSGYRTPSYNASIGGATYSRHMYGDGVDIDANSLSEYNALNSAFSAESPSYVESWAEAGQNHWHPPAPPRLPPPKPPRPPPPAGRSSRGLASLTVRARPPHSAPFRALMTSSALSAGTSTKPKPRERPVSRSVATRAEITSEYGVTADSRSWLVTVQGRLPK
jgi:hypothetical protein